MTSRSQPCAAPESARPTSATTAAGDWWDARLLGKLLPEHALPVDQYSGDLLCPFCGEPLLLVIERTEDGPETMGHCAACVAVVQVEI